MNFLKLLNKSTTLYKSFKSNTIIQRSFSTGFRVGVSKDSLFSRIKDENKQLLHNLQSQNTMYLSRLITLIESKREDHQEQSRLIISYLLQKQRESKDRSFRIGISGPPGAGKSTFIEYFGKYLTGSECNHKVAILAIDPSSVRSGGSILGDKTRMTELSVDPNAFIRPSSSRGTLGGIAKGTADTVVLCESAGFDIVLIETVGVGQSEVSMDDMVDMFVLLVPPANGDELQGLKKGIVESSDIVVVNKADGELMPKARFTVSEYQSAFKLQRPKFENWIPKVLSVSSQEKNGIEKVWKTMCDFKQEMIKSGEFQKKRSKQNHTIMRKIIEEEIVEKLFESETVEQILPQYEEQVKSGEISASYASDQIIKAFLSQPFKVK
ncbi:hypothetical protein DLAC_11587 [Tieghemostelium lacteum]|uniref:Methylmalonic aciduria type A protein n=1 Tax=Tieghemostelium lacteum TaxID=361077 RepID=A0A151ZJN8_TIELA|nr:hypothetical protein DLAC_11587 [Tieghemostelium lacteum]|eukprot:KYQ94137.1 hypothetical protein DLAC_11587 [Tieghemostelium lacteum]